MRAPSEITIINLSTFDTRNRYIKEILFRENYLPSIRCYFLFWCITLNSYTLGTHAARGGERKEMEEKR